MTTKTHERLPRIDAVPETPGKSHPVEVEAFANFMSKAESGPTLAPREKKVLNVALSYCA